MICLYILIFLTQLKNIDSFPLEDETVDFTVDYDYGESFVSNRSKLWQNGIIPFKFVDEEGFGRRYLEDEKELVVAQMKKIEDQTQGCITFVDIKASGQKFFPQQLLIHKKHSEECKATVGYNGDDSALNLGNSRCFVDEGPTILHELGHVIGMVHEQIRPDRDDFIKIINENVDFRAKVAMEIKEQNIMHYPKTTGCKENTTCIEIKEEYKVFLDDNVLEKYPDKLSPADIVEISRAYNCTINETTLERYKEYENRILNGRYRGKEWFNASKEGDVDTVNELISVGINVNAVDDKGRTSLMYAARYGHLKVVKLLLENNADVQAKDNKDWTSLMHAAKNGHLEVVKKLLEQNAGVNAKNSIGKTSLMYAAQNGHHVVVKLLLENNADVEAKSNSGWTSLMYAAHNGHLEVVKKILEQNADVNAKNSENGTSLMIAANKGHLEVIKLLLENNADVQAKDNSGTTSLMYAAKKGHLEVIKFLLENNADVQAKNKSDKDDNGKTILMYAVYGGHHKVVKLLLEHNADVQAKDNDGKTSLMFAAEYGHHKVIEVLLEHNADVKAKDIEGKTALEYAIDCSKKVDCDEIIKLLTE